LSGIKQKKRARKIQNEFEFSGLLGSLTTSGLYILMDGGYRDVINFPGVSESGFPVYICCIG